MTHGDIKLLLTPYSTGLFKIRNGPRGGGYSSHPLYFNNRKSYDLEISIGDRREKVLE